MQDQTPKTTIDPPLGRSSIDRLPKEVREAVNRAIAEAFPYLHRLETACKTQVAVLAMNAALVHVPENVCEKLLREIDAFSPHANDIGALEFQAFMRMLDQMDAEYGGGWKGTVTVLPHGSSSLQLNCSLLPTHFPAYP